MHTQIWMSGPVIEITLRGSDPDSAPVPLQAIVDTGASGICIDRRIALNLGLISSNRPRVEMADGTIVQATAYRAVMKVAGLHFDDWVEVTAFEMALPSSRVLLGRSFLRRYSINYDGPTETFYWYNANSGRLSDYADHDE